MKFRKLLFISCMLFSPLFGVEQSVLTGRISYLKVGTELGIGHRQHKKLHGFDISLNQAVCWYPNWINGKCLYIQYPFYRSFYWGLGAGINYEFNYHSESNALGGLLKGCPNCHHRRIFSSLEGIAGFEFFRDKKVKLFFQGGLSVPIGESSLPFVPALSVGCGF